MANARSIPVAMEINKRFEDLDYKQDIGELAIKMSGCLNACGHHHIGHIGILGMSKGGQEHYQLMLGGSPSDDASIAKVLGKTFEPDTIVDAVEACVKTYLANRESTEERFIEYYRRVGPAPFKEAVYGAN